MELYALNFSPPATDHGPQFTDHIPCLAVGLCLVPPLPARNDIEIARDVRDRRFCDSKSRTVRPSPHLAVSLQPNV
jgi:hypothetical protein